INHFIERRSDQAAQANQIYIEISRRAEQFVDRDHDAKIDHFIVVASQHDADNVFTDVMHVALYSREKDLSLRRRLAGLFLRLHVWNQLGNSLFHHAGAFDDLWQKHLARSEQVAHDVHAIHQRAFDDG